jgi:hypothetical protein
VTIEGGRKRVIRSLRRNWREWEVLIKSHHEGYIGWEEFERNQHLIADNANGSARLDPSWRSAAPGSLPLRQVRQEAASLLWRKSNLLAAVCMSWRIQRAG